MPDTGSSNVTPPPVRGASLAVRTEAVVRGELDLDTIPSVRAAAKALADAAYDNPSLAVVLVLNLQGVTFLDSSALHFLEDLHAEAVERQWALQVLPPTAPGPCRLLRLATSRGWLPADLVQHRSLPAPRAPST